MTAASGPFIPGFEATSPLTPEPPRDDDRPRAITSPRQPVDRLFRGVLRGAGSTVLLITGLIALFLILKASSAFKAAGWGFFTTKTWVPTANQFGIAAVVPDGIYISVIALFFAVPIGLATAIFVSEYAPYRLRGALVALIDLMAAVPSIIYGLWGVFFLQPRIIGPIQWFSEHFAFIPFFKVPGEHSPSTFTASTFLAGVVVSLMVIPIIASITRQVFSQAPASEREAAYALGASRWGMVRTVVLPYGRGGMIGAIMLGFGRAMGETIAVALILSPTFTIVTHMFQNSGNSIPALIALRYQESTPEMLAALMAAGLILFAITLIVNALASIVVNRSRSGAQSEA